MVLGAGLEGLEVLLVRGALQVRHALEGCPDLCWREASTVEFTVNETPAIHEHGTNLLPAAPIPFRFPSKLLSSTGGTLPCQMRDT